MAARADRAPGALARSAPAAPGVPESARALEAADMGWCAAEMRRGLLLLLLLLVPCWDICRGADLEKPSGIPTGEHWRFPPLARGLGAVGSSHSVTVFVRPACMGWWGFLFGDTEVSS